MKEETIFRDSLHKAIVFIIGVAFMLAMLGCGGGGDTSNVTISGKIDDGTLNSPIGDAVCVFYDTNGDLLGQTVADGDGNYSIPVPPDHEGYLICNPPAVPSLTLSTFLSTEGHTDGSKISGEDVTPSTTIVSDIIILEAPPVPQARKLELLHDIETGQDPDLQTVVSLSTGLYKSMLQRQVNVQFSSRDSGADGSGDGGGVGGEAGDGADFSPIPNARCEFIVSNDLSKGTVLYSAALADFLDDGILNRPDLQEVKKDLEEILVDYQPEEIQAAFERVFPGSIGDAYVAITDENGDYFLPVPPSVPGFVRCFPQDQEKLVLVTYVPERVEDETIIGQAVTPATTVFSHKIASRLSDDIGTVKDNFLDDIAGLGDVHIVKEGVAITGFELQGDPVDEDVGLVAFSATALFNILFKNGVNVDYLAALDDFVDNASVDSDFLEGHGIPPDKAAEWSDIVNDSNEETAQDLGSELESALSMSRINVTVTDAPGGNVIAGATVDSDSDLTCDGCGTKTNANGQVVLTFTGVPAEVTNVMVETSAPGYLSKVETTEIAAFATIDLEVVMARPFKLTVQVDGDGEGTVTSSPAGISCGSDCSQDYPEGTGVTLTAEPATGSTFDGWSGSCSGTGTCTATMDRARTVTATFIVSGDPFISNIRHEYYGIYDSCETSSGEIFSGHLYDIYFDFSDPDGDADKSDGAYVTVNSSIWSWADINGDGFSGTVWLSYCNSSPGTLLNVTITDGSGRTSNSLSHLLSEEDSY